MELRLVSDNKQSNVPAMAYTQEEAARAAGVSTVTMRQWVNRSDFPAFKSGKRWIIPVDAFREWLVSNARNRANLGN